MPKLTLHTYWRSSSAYRVRIALAYKGLAYEPVFVNLLEGEQKKPSFVVESPMAQIPCLEIDGVPFVESVAIVEMLDEIHPEPPLLPAPPAERAHVRALVEIINSGTQPMQNLAVLDRLGTDKDLRLAWMKHFMPRGLSAFEALVARYDRARGGAQEGPFSYGASFTMADVYLLPQLYAARRIGLDLSAYPRILRAEKACQGIASIAAAHPDVQPDAKPG